MKNKKPNKNTFARIIKTLCGYYPKLVPVTVFCILFSAIAAAIPDLFIQKVIAVIEKWYTTGDWASAYPELVPKIVFLAVLYLVSLCAVVLYSQLMAVITQGFLKKLRCTMFDGMQNLPIKYFDTHKHGDIMSYFTNDVDTISDALNNSFAMVIQSFIQMVGTLVILFILNWRLSLFVVV